MPIDKGVYEVGYDLDFRTVDPPPGFEKKMYRCQLYKMQHKEGHGMNTDRESLRRWADAHDMWQFEAGCVQVFRLDDGTPVAMFDVWFKSETLNRKYPIETILMCKKKLTEDEADLIHLKRTVEMWTYCSFCNAYAYIYSADTCELDKPLTTTRFIEWRYNGSSHSW